MTYAIIDNGLIAATGDYQELWPDTSFGPDGPTDAFLEEAGAVRVRFDLTHDPATHRLIRTRPFLLGGVVYGVESVALPPPPPPDPQPQWVQFGAAVLFHPLIRAFAAAHPVDYPALVLGFGQAAQGDSQTLMMLWPALRQAGAIGPELAETVAGLAASFDLPDEFVEMLAPPAEP